MIMTDTKVEVHNRTPVLHTLTIHLGILSARLYILKWGALQHKIAAFEE